MATVTRMDQFFPERQNLQKRKHHSSRRRHIVILCAGIFIIGGIVLGYWFWKVVPFQHRLNRDVNSVARNVAELLNVNGSTIIQSHEQFQALATLWDVSIHDATAHIQFLRLAYLYAALRDYRQTQGHYPDSLEELKGNFASLVPKCQSQHLRCFLQNLADPIEDFSITDAITGQPYSYQVASDDFRVTYEWRGCNAQFCNDYTSSLAQGTNTMTSTDVSLEQPGDIIGLLTPQSNSPSSATDTDADGLTDTQETSTYHTDPNKADSDGDGFADGSEIQNGYNPLGPGRLGPEWTACVQLPAGQTCTDYCATIGKSCSNDGSSVLGHQAGTQIWGGESNCQSGGTDGLSTTGGCTEPSLGSAYGIKCFCQ